MEKYLLKEKKFTIGEVYHLLDDKSDQKLQIKLKKMSVTPSFTIKNDEKYKVGTVKKKWFKGRKTQYELEMHGQTFLITAKEGGEIPEYMVPSIDLTMMVWDMGLQYDFHQGANCIGRMKQIADARRTTFEIQMFTKDTTALVIVTAMILILLLERNAAKEREEKEKRQAAKRAQRQAEKNQKEIERARQDAIKRNEIKQQQNMLLKQEDKPSEE